MSRFLLTKTLIMVGMMGAGKTAVGAALARLINVPFLDSDVEIETAANQTIAEIFEEYGESFFREKESQVLTRLLAGEPCVLSTGGGAFLQPNNQQIIAKQGLAVWLRADRDLLWARVRHKNTRPLLRGPDPKGKLFELLAEREPSYAKAGLIVDADPNFSIDDMANCVLQSLLDHPSGVLRKIG